MVVREILKAALRRANIVPQRQEPPGDRMEAAYRLLQGVVSKYNNDNYLSFTQSGVSLPGSRNVIHIYGEYDTMLGDDNRVFATAEELSAYQLSAEDAGLWGFINDGQHDTVVYTVLAVGTPGGTIYQWQPHANVDPFNPRYQQIYRYAKAYHVQVPDVSKLNTLHIDRGQPMGMLKLDFVPRADFDGYPDGSLIWTFKEMAEGEWEIEIKRNIALQCGKLKLDFNRAIRFDLDSDLRIPDAYNELLTVALTHKIALKWPRLDDAQMTRLENEVGVMLQNVRTPKADTKQVLRDDGEFSDRGTYWGVVNGRMWG